MSRTLAHFLENFTFSDPGAIPNGAFGEVLGCWPKGQGPVNPEDKSPFVVKCIDYNKHAGICRQRGHKMHECPDKELKREKELLLIAQDCPFLCRCIDVLWMPRDHMYIIMPRYSCDLLQFLTAHDLNLADLKALGFRLFSGLAFLESKDILHRDIKPENVLLHDTVHSAVLADFGCGREATGSQPTNHIGTQAYHAPEVVMEEPYGMKADMWSAGCLLYLSATKQRPFATPLQAVRGEVHVKEIGDAYGDDTLTGLLEWLFKKKPAERPAAAVALKHPFFVPQADNDHPHES